MLTFWLRFVGAVGAGWLADRIGRKKPLMISIAWFSACNFIAGFAPSFWFLLVFRALLGIGMGAEWPVGAALAMDCGRSGPAVRWLVCCKDRGAWVRCYRPVPMACSMN